MWKYLENMLFNKYSKQVKGLKDAEAIVYRDTWGMSVNSIKTSYS